MDEWVQEMKSNSEALLLVDPEARKKMEEDYLKATIPEDAIAVKTLIGRNIFMV